MKKRRFFALLLALMMVLSLTACGDEPLDAPDGAEQLVVRRLDAQRDAVEAGTAQGAEGLDIAGGVGIRLQRDLRRRRHVEAFAEGAEELGETAAAQIAGGAAAEVDGIDAVGGGAGSDLLHVAEEGSGVIVHLRLAVGQGVEVAVGALLAAEGDMDVQPQGGSFSLHHSRTCGGRMVTAS